MVSNLYFFTATILWWKHALKSDACKNIVLDSMKFLNDNNRVKIYSFVIMPNHIHVVWQVNPRIKKGNLKRDFLKFTAQQIKFELQKSDPELLDEFLVRGKDRLYQIWERESLWFELIKDETIIQKINYIHNNPLAEKWSLAKEPEEYFWSSAKFYSTEKDELGFLHHIGSWKDHYSLLNELRYK